MTQFLLLIGPTYLIALAFLLHWAFGWFETFFPFARSLHHCIRPAHAGCVLYG